MTDMRPGELWEHRGNMWDFLIGTPTINEVGEMTRTAVFST